MASWRTHASISESRGAGPKHRHSISPSGPVGSRRRPLTGLPSFSGKAARSPKSRRHAFGHIGRLQVEARCGSAHCEEEPSALQVRWLRQLVFENLPLGLQPLFCPRCNELRVADWGAHKEPSLGGRFVPSPNVCPRASMPGGAGPPAQLYTRVFPSLEAMPHSS